MIPDFVKGTDVLPEGCHDCKIQEFKDKFVDQFPNSNSRKSRFEGFVQYSIFFCDNVKSTRRNLINGSFTTKKDDPHDVDFVTVINYLDLTSQELNFLKEERVREFRRKNQYQEMKKEVEKGIKDINELYCCDSYVLYKREPHEGELYNEYLKQKEYWLDCWGHTRRDKTGKNDIKGIISLELNSTTFEGI